jgi:hypothetical protein
MSFCPPAGRLWLLIGLLAGGYLLPLPGYGDEAAKGPAPGQEKVFEYLYIDANEDRSSGGHTAVRIDNDVFHFLFKNDYLTMARATWAEFQLSYRGYQNRSIHSTRLEIADSTHELLRDSFLQRFLAQTGQLKIVRDTRRDVALLRAVSEDELTAMKLPGQGFFESSASAVPAGRYQALVEAIAATHGRDYIGQRRHQLQHQLVTLPVEALSADGGDFNVAKLPAVHYPFNQRYADLAAAIRAIDTLLGDAELSDRSLALSRNTGRGALLDDAERQALEQALAGLQQRLVALSASPRPDWGVAFLLGLARYRAISLSLQHNHWVFIDALADDASIVEVGERLRKLVPQLRADAGALWEQARADWRQQDGWSEGHYAAMEIAHANWQELGRIQSGGEDWRIHATRYVPRGLGAPGPLPKPERIVEDFPSLLASMQRSQQQVEVLAGELMGYKLLTRNCVSELFTTIDLALAQSLLARGEPVSRDTLHQETRRRLGYVFTPNSIPYVSSDQVRDNWRVAEYRELLSLRRLYAKSAYQANSELATLLRESNTLTSRVYQPNDKDSFFVFFTDGNALLRPPLGLLNLTAALGASFVGAVQLPFDGGKSLKSGLRGMLFSLPELAFQNIRKGSSIWLSPELLGAAGEAGH